MQDLELETAKYKHRHDLVDKGHVDRFIIHLTINYDMPLYDQLIYTRHKIYVFLFVERNIIQIVGFYIKYLVLLFYANPFNFVNFVKKNEQLQPCDYACITSSSSLLLQSSNDHPQKIQRQVITKLKYLLILRRTHLFTSYDQT